MGIDRYFDLEQCRIIVISALSPILAYFTPTKGFMLSLVIMFAFNIWSGMRADGVAISNCKNFSFRKFKNALFELLLYVAIMQVVFSVMTNCGDGTAGVIVAKSLTYVFMYVYLQNAFRNLIRAYPKIIALRLIYHVIRFEFTRALPSHISELIARYERENEGADINLKKKDAE